MSNSKKEMYPKLWMDFKEWKALDCWTKLAEEYFPNPIPVECCGGGLYKIQSGDFITYTSLEGVQQFAAEIKNNINKWKK